MTEREWEDSEQVMPMLEFAAGKASPRQLRLFACACCRLPGVWCLLPEMSQNVVRTAEQFARGAESFDHLARVARQGAWYGGTQGTPANTFSRFPSVQAERAAGRLATDDPATCARLVVREAQDLIGTTASDLLREFVRYPRRPVTGGSFLVAWNDGAILRLAREIDEESAPEHISILGDALDDAGAAPDLVAHCHSGKPHLPGCWVIEFILGRS